MATDPTNIKLPNLFVGGAPKCGTTSLTMYLRTHPNIFVCEPKEPGFWACDMPGIRVDLGFETIQKYRSLFSAVQKDHQYSVDGTTLYLYSETAIPNILNAVPDAKFIFSLRNPIEVAHAYHMQMFFYEQDDQADFETAWRLQDARAVCTDGIPKRCLCPKLLQYRYIAAIGSQLERLFQIVPREFVHLILMDDLKSDPAKVYSDVLLFLGLPHDGRSEFGKENAAMQSRSKTLTRLMRTRTVRRVTRWAKQNLSGAAYRLAKRVKNNATFKNVDRHPISARFQTELRAYFRPEVERIETILVRDLSAWKE